MKTNVLLLMLLFFVLVDGYAAPRVNITEDKQLAPLLNDEENAYQTNSIEDFLNLTPKKIKEKTGQKLSFKETLVLKAAQKRIKKAGLSEGGFDDNPKSQVVALILVIFAGVIGIHRFYLGYTMLGILQILTLGGCGVWALIDLIMIATGDLKPIDGSDYDPTL